MRCLLCLPKQTDISAFKNSTSNLRKHVARIHPNKLAKYTDLLENHRKRKSSSFSDTLVKNAKITAFAAPGRRLRLWQDTPLMIEQAELLEGHHKLMNLECSWNDFMYEQYRMGSKNTHKMNLIRNYFGKVEGLSDDLVKQLWIVLHRAMGKAGGHSEQ
ncbi:hypothetical protein J4Q44_G00020500 [Coregonus suidteri]|uniref:BED-type domain-containing protein n=1 Tax=Coregonus suidteri TaxID=861788 RepID=A0AAN8R3D8_9TELE